MSTLLLSGPTRDYRHHYSATAVGPSANTDIATWWAHSELSALFLANGCGPIRECQHCYSVGPFTIIDIIIRRRLWAHTRISTLLLWWAHSGLWTLYFGGGRWPIHKYRHQFFSGPIRDYRYFYFMVTVGPFIIIVVNIQLWMWAHLTRSAYLQSILISSASFLKGPTWDYPH